MERTRRRPLPSRAISRTHALLLALLALAAGLGVLNELVRPLAALLGLANVLIYTLVYTPLKWRTPWCTPVGAICGALPPVMGWVGAGGGLRLEPALLAATMLLWQVPHSLSLVWMDRADYARAGYRMLPVVDPSGRLTTLTIALYWLALMPLGLVASFCRLAGFLFGAVSLLLGLVLFLLALRLRSAKTRQEARRVFLASVVYLPLLLVAMVADPPAHGPSRGKAGRGAVEQATDRAPQQLSKSAGEKPSAGPPAVLLLPCSAVLIPAVGPH